jgi:hypothetical protein
MREFCVCGHHKDLHKPCDVDGKMVPTNCTGLTYLRWRDSIDPELIGKFEPDRGPVICGCHELRHDEERKEHEHVSAKSEK